MKNALNLLKKTEGQQQVNMNMYISTKGNKILIDRREELK